MSPAQERDHNGLCFVRMIKPQRESKVTSSVEKGNKCTVVHFLVYGFHSAQCEQIKLQLEN
jgi:hypothetical protein